MKDTKTSPGKTTKPGLKKSDIGHALFKAMSNLGAEFEKPQLKKSDIGRAVMDAFSNLGAEFEEPKLKKSDLGQKLLEAMLKIDWSNPPKVKV